MAGQPYLMYSLACSQYIADCELRIASNTLREKKKHLREFASYIRKDCRLQDCAMDDVTLSMARAFHAVNGGSNPPGDAKNFNRLQQLSFWVTKIGLQFFLRRLSLEEFLF